MTQVNRIARLSKVQDALAAIKVDLPRVIDLAIAIQQIPAPTFDEGERAAFIETRFTKAGLSDVRRDRIHNVFGRYPGRKSGSPIVVTAHIDTVFKNTTDLGIRFEDASDVNSGLIYGPGLADNSLGAAGLILLAETLRDFQLRPIEDIWLVANVGEEGLGNLKGMRSVVEKFGQTANYIVVSGGSYGHIFHEATGVKRFRIVVNVPGGHSWGDFGQPNAIHKLSEVITRLQDIKLPSEFKTTHNIGTIEGGTTVNTIAAEAQCLVDIRSTNKQALDTLVRAVRILVEELKLTPTVKVIMTEIGNRPAGAVSLEEPIIGMAADALKEVGCKEPIFLGGSTDANLPISLGFPAVCIGLAQSGNTHTVDEYMNPAMLPQGMGQLLLLTLAAAGLTTD